MHIAAGEPLQDLKVSGQASEWWKGGCYLLVNASGQESPPFRQGLHRRSKLAVVLYGRFSFPGRQPAPCFGLELFCSPGGRGALALAGTLGGRFAGGGGGCLGRAKQARRLLLQRLVCSRQGQCLAGASEKSNCLAPRSCVFAWLTRPRVALKRQQRSLHMSWCQFACL